MPRKDRTHDLWDTAVRLKYYVLYKIWFKEILKYIIVRPSLAQIKVCKYIRLLKILYSSAKKFAYFTIIIDSPVWYKIPSNEQFIF